MLEINGYKFAEKESEIVDSLFMPGGTVSGKVKRFKRKIMFYTLQEEPFAVINQENVTGTVKKLKNKMWFNYGTPYFIEGLAYSKTKELTEALALDHDSNGLIFK